jgi:glycosyltransferase involved in cell wall biosynthesis
LAEKSSLGNYVDFYGRVPDDLMIAILNTSDLCVNPDKPTEMNNLSTMNKIMEYMALGKPIVQYDLKEGRFSAQTASLYAKPNDRDDFAQKIIELFDNPELRKEMGEFGKNRVENVLQWKYEEVKLKKAYMAAYEN